MDIKIEKGKDKTTVLLSGSIDIPGAEKLKQVLNQLLSEKVKEVSIDFEEVTFIGSSGIGKLLLFYKNFTSIGCRVRIVKLNSELKALFKTIKLDKLFNL